MLSLPESEAASGGAQAGAAREPALPTQTFRSVLDLSPEDEAAVETPETPPCFVDLNLDQIVASIIAGKNEYGLAPFFYRPLKTRAALAYRQDVMRDLENDARLDAINEFAASLRSARGRVAQAGKLYYQEQKEAWLLDAAALYRQAVVRLLSRLQASKPTSAGLAGFLAYLDEYVGSPAFRRLSEDVATVAEKLAAVRYNLLIGAGFVTVSACADEPDYGAEIQADFEKFKQGAAADHDFKFSDTVQMNHIEAGVLARVALLHPDAFAELHAFVARHADFVDPTVDRFDREIQFYVAYVAHMRRIAAAGVRFCYPSVSATSKTIGATECYDVALAGRSLDHRLPIVTNDFHLDGRERILVVSGPNQGGKTTFARTFGQLHYLAALGCPVPAASADLYLFDRLFTHFEREEDIRNLRGKLHDDLSRLRDSLSQATPNSIIILNEVFNSTSLRDAVFLCNRVLTRIVELDAICVCVTFIDELATLSATTVSMASNVRPDNLAERTFKITRRPPDGLAYALSIAEKYRLAYAQLRERLGS